MALCAIAAALFAIAQADEPTVTIYDDLANLGFSLESVEYDADRDIYYWCGWSNGGIGTISGLGGSNAVFIPDVIPPGQSSAPSGCTGMVYQNNKLYVNNILRGTFSTFDVVANTRVGLVNPGVGLNGLCVDPDNTDTLYATGGNFGAQAAIYSVNISTDTAEFTRIYQGQSNNYGFQFVPNGCIVKNGIVYITAVQSSATAALVMYDIAQDSWTFDTTTLPVYADGIVEIDGVLYVTASEGGLMKYTIGSGGVFENVKDPALTDWPVNDAADMCVGKDGSLVFPENIGLPGKVYYVTLPSGQTNEPTAYPTSNPTMTNSPTVMTSNNSTSMPTVTLVETTGDIFSSTAFDEGKATMMSVGYISGFVFICAFWMNY